MLKRLIVGALFAGLSAGALAALLQLSFVVPLIHEGELYETGVLTHFAAPSGGHDHDHGAGTAPEPAPDTATGTTPGTTPGTAMADHDHPEGTPPHDHGVAPAFDLGRPLGTVGFFSITYTGFALLLVAGFALSARVGHQVTARGGIVWGLAGFLAVQLAPAFGLPPELPGAAAAALEARQVWWAACVAATGAGIALIAFGRGAVAIGLAIVLIALPHLIGAPTAAHAGVVPPELAAHFAARSLAAGALCWAVLGGIAGAIWAG